MLKTLREMKEADEKENFDDAEIACDGLVCYIGARQISRRTVNALLKLTLIKADWSGGIERYVITETARHVLERPELEDELCAAILNGKNFTIADDHRIKLI